jgi:hypothetical protein
LNRFKDGVSDESAGLQDLDSDEGALLVQFGGDVRTQLDASRLRPVGDHHVQNLFLFEVGHARTIHGATVGLPSWLPPGDAL